MEGSYMYTLICLVALNSGPQHIIRQLLALWNTSIGHCNQHLSHWVDSLLLVLHMESIWPRVRNNFATSLRILLSKLHFLCWSIDICCPAKDTEPCNISELRHHNRVKVYIPSDLMSNTQVIVHCRNLMIVSQRQALYLRNQWSPGGAEVCCVIKLYI